MIVEQDTRSKEHELVKKSLENPEYFGEIMRLFRAPLSRYIRRLAQISKDEVEHILQDSFIKLYENLNDYDPELSLSSWVYRITHNKTIDYMRSKKVHAVPVGDDEDGIFEKAVETFNIETHVDRELLQKRIRHVLDSLPEKYKSALVLRFIEEKSYSEISDILKKPPGTIATLLSRAKEAFKKEVEKQNIQHTLQ